MSEPRSPAVDATEACLANIESHNCAVNAMITPLPESARIEAAAADRAASEGRWLGLLHGMPVALKDNIEMAGVRTTSGSLLFENNIPNADAPVVDRLRAAGAVFVGKATMHELAFGVRSTNPISGQCRNPWNLDHVPGGSSGGSGAAVAAEMCVGALGTDTGGSVRCPASMNGVTGLRPTHGAIPITGITPVSVSHDSVGPLARRVEDVARLFAVLCGYEPNDPQSRERSYENFLPTLGQGIEGLRIGLPSRFYFDDLLPQVETAVRAAAQVFERLGAELCEIDIEGAENSHRWAATIIYADMCAHYGERIVATPEMFSDQVRERIAAGLDYSGADVAHALTARDVWRRTIRNVFDGVDLILVPTIPGEAPRIEDSRSLLAATHDATRFTYGGALAKIPGLSLPCGFTDRGLPIGVMLEAAWWNEPLLFRAGYAFQQETDWHLRRAPLLDAD